MQQQQQTPGGAPSPQFGQPPSDQMAAFPSSAAVNLHPPPPPKAASPITTRPPAPANFDELGSAVAGGFPDEEALAAGEEAERGGAAGNRWPRQEALALLKIRSEMDAAFRDATFKGPLWEEVSRKLAELGYKRSAKKCKEKFENVHKYYKRTKEGRAGRQDGKTYRFFTQLEALHSSGAAGGAETSHNTATVAPALAAASPAAFTFATPMAGPPSTRIQPLPISASAPPLLVTPPTRVVADLSPPGISAAAAAEAAGISFSSDSSTSSSSESEEEEEMERAGGSRGGRKRKRAGGGSRYRRQMMIFFEGLMKQVMERQEAMQQRFLEAIEKREQERMKREEAWRLQEMTRLSREQELLAQERAMAASRDTAVISYLQKISGQSIPFPVIPVTNAPTSVVQPLSSQPPQPPLAPTPQPVNPSTLPLSSASIQQKFDTPRHIQASEPAPPKPVPPAALPAPISSEPLEAFSGGVIEPVSSSRWPKAEVHTLIKLRSGLELRYQEPGPKGPLWEEISAGMQRIGYNRSAKRCKEKWENINKYFKKVKESNKKRPEDSKTCPYFHQLDALYRRKLQLGSSGTGVQQQQQDAAQEDPQLQSPTDSQGNTGNRNGGSSERGGGSNSSNGGHPSLFEEGMKKVIIAKCSPRACVSPNLHHTHYPIRLLYLKPVDIVTELLARQQQHQQQEEQQQQHQGVMDDYDKMDEADSDNQLDHDEDDDEDDEDSKMQYKIQFQRQTVSSGGGESASTTAAAATTQAGSFLAMVQ